MISMTFKAGTATLTGTSSITGATRSGLPRKAKKVQFPPKTDFTHTSFSTLS